MPVSLERYWKCEYENLRRKYKKQMNQKEIKLSKFMNITWELLKNLGMSEEEILIYYERKQNGNL